MRIEDTTAKTTFETQESTLFFRETAAGERLQRNVALTAILLLAAAMLALCGVIAYGIHARVAAAAKLKQTAEQAAVPTVSIVSPTGTAPDEEIVLPGDRKSTRLNSSHMSISYAVFC